MTEGTDGKQDAARTLFFSDDVGLRVRPQNHEVWSPTRVTYTYALFFSITYVQSTRILFRKVTYGHGVFLTPWYGRSLAESLHQTSRRMLFALSCHIGHQIGLCQVMCVAIIAIHDCAWPFVLCSRDMV